MADDLELVTVEEAARIVGKTPHNIRDYIQRGRIAKYNEQGEPVKRAQNGRLRVSLKEIRIFLSLVEQGLEKHHRAGLHPELGFHDVPEHQRTKHVHRLHPYLGKFIPQLVEWFLARYFQPDDVILDPFMGSGTTLIQGNEMLLEWVAIRGALNPDCKIHTGLAIPYNPYEPQPYARWTFQGMFDTEHELKVAEEFWDFLGGRKGCYQELLEIFERIGVELRPEIDAKFTQFADSDMGKGEQHR